MVNANAAAAATTDSFPGTLEREPSTIERRQPGNSEPTCDDPLIADASLPIPGCTEVAATACACVRPGAYDSGANIDAALATSLANCNAYNACSPELCCCKAWTACWAISAKKLGPPFSEPAAKQGHPARIAARATEKTAARCFSQTEAVIVNEKCQSFGPRVLRNYGRTIGKQCAWIWEMQYVQVVSTANAQRNTTCTASDAWWNFASPVSPAWHASTTVHSIWW